jgi:CheY-like chemotaxis protein
VRSFATPITATSTGSTVSNGIDALDLYDQRGADLIITDHAMPGMQGLAFSHQLGAVSYRLPAMFMVERGTLTHSMLC